MELHPALYAWFALTYLADLLEALVVGVNWKEHTERIAAKVSNTPYNASRVDCHMDPVQLIVERGPASVDDGEYAGIRLFMLNPCSKVVSTGIIVWAERSRLIDRYVPLRENYNWRSCECPEESANTYFHYGSKVELSALLSRHFR